MASGDLRLVRVPIELPGGPHAEMLRDPEELASHAAGHLAVLLRAAVAERGRASLVLAGGKTPRRSYERLAGEETVPWERVHLFWGDERCVPPDHETSNYRMAREALIERIAIPAGNVHRIAGELPPEEAAEAAEREIRATLGEEPLFDVVLLGMGADGHTASLFPGTSAMAEAGRLVAATWVPQLQAHRVTMTTRALAASRAVVFTVAGAEKGPALARAMGARSDPAVPASCIHSQGEVLWLLDAEAARTIVQREAP